jgi:hypothetical protein
MIIELSREDRIIIEDLKSGIIKFSKKLYSLIIIISTVILEGLLRYISSLQEFSIANIRDKGLINILTDRAMRFFKFSIQEEGRAIRKKFKGIQKRKANMVNSNQSNGLKSKNLFLKRIRLLIKICCFPFYLLILSIQILYINNDTNVKNQYKT